MKKDGVWYYVDGKFTTDKADIPDELRSSIDTFLKKELLKKEKD